MSTLGFKERRKKKNCFKLLSADHGDVFVESQICNPDLVTMSVVQKE